MSLESPPHDCDGRRIQAVHPRVPRNTGRRDSRNMAILIAQGMVSKDIVLLRTVTNASPMGWIEVIRIYEDRCRVCQSCREDR